MSDVQDTGLGEKSPGQLIHKTSDKLTAEEHKTATTTVESDNTVVKNFESVTNLEEKHEYICVPNESGIADSGPNPSAEESAKIIKQKHVCDSFDRPHVDKNVMLVQKDADVVENIREQDKEIMDLRKADPKSNEAVIKPPVPYMDIDGSSIQPNTGGYTSPALLVRPFDSSLTNRSPTRSPSYVRKPLPINEPKPVLPKSKHLKTEAGSSSSSLAIIRASVIEEENSSGESIEKQKCSDGLKRNQSDGLKNVQDRSSKSESIEEANKKTSVSSRKSCPMSPRLPTRNRPSTLMLDKRERVKRSSAVSATPSTDSSKSSKTFEFIEYDSDTREKILEAAIREEDAFLEFVKSLNIEPDPIIEAGNARDKKKVESHLR